MKNGQPYIRESHLAQEKSKSKGPGVGQEEGLSGWNVTDRAKGKNRGVFLFPLLPKFLILVSQDFVLGPPVFFICILSLGELIQSVALSTVFMIMTF